MTAGVIRTGMGGWSYKPWRDSFYPADLAQRRELEYASHQVSAIEINSTFYRLQKPEVFTTWREQTPANFVFAAKASRVATYRKSLADAAESVRRFTQGIAALAPKLGPINWQLPPSKRFVADEIAAFLAMLPDEAAGVPLRHALEVRHASFMCAQFLDLARSRNVAVLFADTDEYPSFADVTADFIYARLMRSVATEPTGYSRRSLEAWSDRAWAWAQGGEPEDLPKLERRPPASKPRDVFLFFIGGAKERAPLAAHQLGRCLQSMPQ